MTASRAKTGIYVAGITEIKEPFSLRTSLVAHLAKNLPAMQETPVRFLGLEDPLEKR